METLTSKIDGEESCCSEEYLLIQDYGNSEALKDAIREEISNYARMGWKSVNILREGPFIRLTFKDGESEG